MKVASAFLASFIAWLGYVALSERGPESKGVQFPSFLTQLELTSLVALVKKAPGMQSDHPQLRSHLTCPAANFWSCTLPTGYTYTSIRQTNTCDGFDLSTEYFIILPADNIVPSLSLPSYHHLTIYGTHAPSPRASHSPSSAPPTNAAPRATVRSTTCAS